MRLIKKIALFSIVGMLTLSCQEKVAPPTPFGPLPTQKQLDWHELEFYAFVHFTTNTFTNKEWGFGDESPEIFNPTALDTRQWARVVKEAGMKGIILTAKHHDGFCLWPSEYTDHSVERSPWKEGKGDVVRELANACKEYGLKLGLYLSPWDRNHPEYGREDYVTYFRNQLKELLTNYGDVFEMWFDGANGGNGYYGGANETRKINTLEYYDWQTTYDSIYKWSPNTLVWGVGPSEARWIGNEEGFANKTNWSLLRQKDELAGKVHYKEFMSGHEDGERWVPGEADVSIRPGWFYHAVEDDKVKSIGELVDIYYHSVGRNANLLLNLPVDRRGIVHENDEARLKELVAVLKEDFKTELLSKTKASADNVRGGSKKYGVQNVLDDNKETYWATDDTVKTASLEFRFGAPTPVNRILLQEYVKLGQRVRKFNVEAEVNGQWQAIANETTIGYKRILRTDRVTATALKINITDSKASPVISTVQAYNASTLVHAPEVYRNKEGMVEMKAHEEDVIYYTTDGSEPSQASDKFEKPFKLEGSATINAIARNEEEQVNSVMKTVKYGVSKANWKIVSVKGGDKKGAERVIDGNFATTWRTNGNKQLPHEIVIDMGKTNDITGFTYMPQQTGNGLHLVKTYGFYTSNDGKNWTKQSEGEFSNIKHNPILQEKTFNKTKARYLRFVAKSEVEGSTNVSIAEIGIIE
ncbi:alpha-L-fucosidase [Tamlana sp. 2201CG12-4]|uniref:alpha-L-fucosidase n=1 Tax=Tamlana sp. 2201CG12-4 TaxID=3112582 RepID=UPI002DBBB374|nr:alpha-L-fucosidase [Tamlana sp. 2201CG12-4]MEC3908491.1 alpha-L-fucosidase [Tamlana sp. 2201CG12-4]